MRGDHTSEAETLASELDTTFPLMTVVQKYRLPAVRAAIALQRKDPGRAIELLQLPSTMELATAQDDSGILSGALLPVYLRGQAFLMLHDGNRAAAEFQKFIDHRGLVGNFPLGAMAHLQLARSYGEAGNKAKAKAYYQEFLNLWKDADSDIPILKQAKAECATLQ